MRTLPFVFALFFTVFFSTASIHAEDSSLHVEERIVAGSADDFMIVRHLVLRGTNFAIGEKLADIARERHGVRKDQEGDAIRNRARVRFFRQNFPIYLERMRGAAKSFGLPVEARDFTGLGYPVNQPGCSVVFFPPTSTGDELGGVLSRNFDFTTGLFGARHPGPGQIPVVARPYILELHPDEGHASICVVSYDLLGGTIDGINSEGLSVALLADDELMSRFQMEGTVGTGVGLGEVQTLRILLDTCATIEEAKETLLSTKQHYHSIPCHYIIADRSGRSFVWEHSHAHNREYIVDSNGTPQITTNFSLHRYPDLEALPEEKHPQGAFNRYRRLKSEIVQRGKSLGRDDIVEITSCVAACGKAPQGRPPGRTLWHSLYYPEEARMEIDFYLGESVGPDGEAEIRRSGYLAFELE